MPKAAARWRVELCAAFEIGGPSSNGCPANYSRLETEAACKSAAAIAGKTINEASRTNNKLPVNRPKTAIKSKFFGVAEYSSSKNSIEIQTNSKMVSGTE